MNELSGQALWDAMKKEPTQWVLTTEGMYYDMLEVLPPAAIGHAAFLVGEPYTHNQQGEAVHACFANIYGEFFARYSTIREFREYAWRKAMNPREQPQADEEVPYASDSARNYSKQVLTAMTCTQCGNIGHYWCKILQYPQSAQR